MRRRAILLARRLRNHIEKGKTMNRMTSITLHFHLVDGGAVHVKSDDISGLELQDDEPRRLGTQLGCILVKEAQRRLCPLILPDELRTRPRQIC